MNTIKPIQTRYAGCHFRSRLEARWAVFFDTLGIRWEYEPEGFEVHERLSLGPKRWPYLPDFWLPDEKMWVEVKGSWTAAECDLFLNAAACLITAGDTEFMLLGPDFPIDRGWSPLCFHMHKGDLTAHSFASGWGHSDPLVARDVGPTCYEQGSHNLDDLTSLLLRGAVGDYRYSRALVAAKTARFEHGHSGAS